MATWATIEQRVYLSRVLPVLRAATSPDDPRIKVIERTDSLGFDSGSWKITLTDGWVMLFGREYGSYDPDDYLFREWIEHQIFIYKDSRGKIYIKAQGFFPPDDLDEKGAFDLYPSSKDESLSDYFKEQKAYPGDGRYFWEVTK